MLFLFPYSHAFPGGRVVVEGDAAHGAECLVEFGDGTTVIAERQLEGEAIRLRIPSYCTAKGTRIAARVWTLVRDEDGAWRSRRAS